MPVTKQSLLKELRSIENDVLRKQEQADQELDAIRVTIAMVEERPEKRSKERSSFVANVTDAIYDILQKEGPLHRNEICKAVQKKGLHIGGESPVATIGTYLSDDPRFKNVSRGIWGAVDASEMSEVPGKNGHVEGVVAIAR